MPRRKEGGSAKSFFSKVGNFLKPVAKAVSKPLIGLAKPIVTAGLSTFAPELAPAIAVGVDALGNMADKAIQGMGIRLTAIQAHRLRHGGEITVTRSALMPNRPTHSLTLHPERLQKLMGMIKENHPKIAMKLHEGEGVWDWVKKSAKSVGKALAPIAIKAGKKAFTDKYGDEYSGVADVLGNAAQEGISGMGVKSHRKRHRKSGGGVPLVKVSKSGIVSTTQHSLSEYVPVMGGAINTHGGMNQNENYVEYPIQLGSPYAKINSPAMNPFMPTHSQLSGYNPIYKRGGSFSPPGGGGIMPAGGHGGGILPAGARF